MLLKRRLIARKDIKFTRKSKEYKTQLILCADQCEFGRKMVCVFIRKNLKKVKCGFFHYGLEGPAAGYNSQEMYYYVSPKT